jgi:hypothetical protein
VRHSAQGALLKVVLPSPLLPPPVVPAVRPSLPSSLPFPACSAFKTDMFHWMREHVIPVAGVAFGIAVLQVITIITSCTIIHRGKVEERKAKAAEQHQHHGGQQYAPPGQTVYVAVDPYRASMHATESRFQ